MSFTVLTASAGAGKTYSLTSTISEALSGANTGAKAPLPSEIIATTFTKKAAGELVERLHARLIDEGKHQLANEIDSALIGTVNSIAGSIVTAYAIDAGLSPSIRILGDSEQKTIFRAAIDSTISRVETENHELLSRLGHLSGIETSTPSFTREESWSSVVETICAYARTNGISAVQLQESAQLSIESMLASFNAAGFEEESDSREQWRSTFKICLEDLRADSLEVKRSEEAGESLSNWPSDDEKINKRSIANVHGSVIALEQEMRYLDAAQINSIPWSRWIKLAKLSVKSSHPEAKEPGARPKAVFAPFMHMLEGADDNGEAVPGAILANAAFRADLAQLITLAFNTAAEALDAFAQYKSELAVMDFIDQETIALNLVTNNKRVRESLRSRYSFLAVDEFQDTSPLQLELFLRISELVDTVVWVGDQKQSIYGFRGADPELMSSIVAAVADGSGPFAGGKVSPLGYSYRTTAPVLSFTNALFSKVFHSMDPGSIVLNIPESRAGNADGGIEIWKGPENERTSRRKASNLRESVATGILQLLRSGLTIGGRPVSPGDIAVLSRSGTPLGTVAEGLKCLGIPTTSKARNLLEGRESHIILAALAYLIDQTDSLAITELVVLLNDHAAHDHWFADLGELEDRGERRDRIESWREDPSFEVLRHLAPHAARLTPGELVLCIIEAFDLTGRIKSWSKIDQRLANLDDLHALACQYEEESTSAGAPMSINALRQFILDNGAEFSSAAVTPDAVTLGTIHSAKGLEWPIVIVLESGNKSESRESVTVVSTDGYRFDPHAPLAGRYVHYLPLISDSFGPMRKALSFNPHVVQARAKAHDEEARILYVALTRAKNHLILAGETELENSIYNDFVPGFVDEREKELRGQGGGVQEPGEVIEFVRADGGVAAENNEFGSTYASNELRVFGARLNAGEPGHNLIRDVDSEHGGSAVHVPVVLKFHELPSAIEDRWQAERSPLGAQNTAQAGGAATGSRFESRDALARRFLASGLHYTPDGVRIGAVEKLGEPLVTEGVSSAAIGEAVHAYLATPFVQLTEPMKRSLAERIHERWLGTQGGEGVGHTADGDRVSVETILRAGERWLEWKGRQFPGAASNSEAPVAWWNADGQAMEGWVDEIVESADGRTFIVDHKTFTDTDHDAIRTRINKKYAAQLDAYRQALEARGVKVAGAYIHAPLAGLIVPVAFAEGAVGDPGAGARLAL